jgi:hypothetical protein
MASKWRRIETAPRDGTVILLGWSDGDHIPCVGWFCTHGKYWRCDRERQWGGKRHMVHNAPTHWVALPNPVTPE